MNKKIRSIILSTGLALGLTFSFPATAKAATYTVVKGDSLYFISQIFHTSVANLMKDNNLNNYNLDIGQILNVPSNIHKVQKGETLWLISQKYNITLDSLRRANNIYSNYIDIGQILNIPSITPTMTESTPPVVEEKVTEPWQNYSASELDLLARLIMAETESQPYQAKVAVGAVVLNRVKSGVFASTVTEVINQKYGQYYQFTPVENGWINRPANEECIKAAKEALNGADPTNGALFYYDDSATNTWILEKPISIKIGRMIYAY